MADRRLVGFRRVLPKVMFRPLRDYFVDEHGRACLHDTGLPERTIEAVYEGDEGWEEVACLRSRN